MATNGTQITDPIEFTKLSAQQLDDIFSATTPGELPVGLGDGAAIIAPGSEVSDDIARFIHISTWKGKAFERDEANPNRGWLKNRLLLLGTKAIVADVYKGRAGSMGKSASCSTTRTPRSSRSGSAMRSARSAPASFSASSFGARRKATAKR